MAKVALAIERVPAAGLIPTGKGSLKTEDEYQFKNDGDCILLIDNGGSEDCEVTVVTPGTVAGNPIDDRKVTVVKETVKYIGNLDPSAYNDGSGLRTIKFSKITGVKVAVLRG